MTSVIQRLDDFSLYTSIFDIPSQAYPAYVKGQVDKSVLRATGDLKAHQQIAVDYIKNDMKRGILLYHGMGTGKTVVASNIARHYLDNTDRNVIFMSSKSLQSNFANTIGDNYARRIQFVTMNSNNVLDQINNSDVELIAHAISALKQDNLENAVLIVDEVHNLLNAIANKSQNAMDIYKLLMLAKDIKIVFMTGTPIVNSPMEMCVCFNILRGYMSTSSSKNTIMPETLEDFRETFIDTYETIYKGNITKIDNLVNTDILKARLFSLVSYYETNVDPSGSSAGDFPEDLGIDAILVPMSQKQYSRYSAAEVEEAQQRSSYKAKTRKLSNYAEVSDKLEDNSPKYAKAIEMVKSTPGASVIYSQFVNGTGLEHLAELLEKEMPGKVGIITGNISTEDRDKIVKKFNADDNKDASKMKVILLSAAGAEGLDLKRVRNIHILEPYWNMARINQIKTRGVRYKSHIDLPKDQQNVKTYLYISDVYKHGSSKKPTDKYELFKMDSLPDTVDKYIYQKANAKQHLIAQLEQVLKESSIDCTVFGKNCELSEQSNKPMYLPSINQDIKYREYGPKIIEDSIVLYHLEDTIYYDINMNVYEYNSSQNTTKIINDKKYKDMVETIFKDILAGN